MARRTSKRALATQQVSADGSIDDLDGYREHLVQALQKAHEDFDKTVLTLSGGALVVSITFVKDIVGPGSVIHKGLLMLSWFCWGISVTSVLISYY
jgi:hypothetical protein